MKTSRPEPRARRLPLAPIFAAGLAFCWLATTAAVCTRRAAAQTTCNRPNNNPNYTWSVGPGRPCQNLQAVLDLAWPGDTIQLDAGATFAGPITLPAKTPSTNPDNDWITIRSSAPDASLPAPGQRIDPSYANVLPKIVSQGGNAPAVQTARRAQRYRLVGVEITMTPRDALTESYELVNLVQLGDGTETDIADAAHHLVFDRCYIHGQPNTNLRRGIALNSEYTDIINSHISDCHVIGREAQAIGGWNGRGPFSILNNYLEAAGENIMFGGDLSSYLNPDNSRFQLIPADIVIRRNHFFKKRSWRVGDPTYAGYHWTVKNLLELKNARRVVVDGNVLEYTWADAQGHALVFTVRGENGQMPWATVEDVVFVNNIVRHVASAINLLGRDYFGPSQLGNRIVFRNNLFDDVNGTTWCGPDCGTSGRFLQIQETDRVAIDHNTVFHTGSVAVASGVANTLFLFNNNLLAHNDYGIHGDNAASGLGDPNNPSDGALDIYFPGYVFRRNLLAGANPTRYPTDNFYPLTLDDAGFADRAGGNYRLAPTSPYKNAGTDGKDIGADIDALEASIGRPNGIDSQRFFVAQHYLDFLDRGPVDPEDGQAGAVNLGGWDFWTGQITQCGADAGCLRWKRVDVSRAFFYSSEFIRNNPALADANRGTDSYNREFVRQCYYRYLRRRGDPATYDPGGFNFWVNKLNTEYPALGNGAYNNMIDAFLLSGEYRARFGQP